MDFEDLIRILHNCVGIVRVLWNLFKFCGLCWNFVEILGVHGVHLVETVLNGFWRFDCGNYFIWILWNVHRILGNFCKGVVETVLYGWFLGIWHGSFKFFVEANLGSFVNYFQYEFWRLGMYLVETILYESLWKLLCSDFSASAWILHIFCGNFFCMHFWRFKTIFVDCVAILFESWVFLWMLYRKCGGFIDILRNGLFSLVYA